MEIQCDGLIGPTHHYGGLSHGNVASGNNAENVSYPKQAALQGLEKMKFVHSLGVPQIIIPPHSRPNFDLLRQMGVAGGDAEELLQNAYVDNPYLLSQAYSAASMWVANMATISPELDTFDGRLHITPANLAATLHRQQEADFSYKLLQQIFGKIAEIHHPLPATISMVDEGAANHMRLSDGHGAAGVEVFVYGKEANNKSGLQPVKYPARQSLESVEALAYSHKLAESSRVFIQQNPEAIDAGVFHNDVIAMSNGSLLIYHEKAFVDSDAKIAEIANKIAPDKLMAICVKDNKLPLQEAVSSYFFNSQLVTLPDGNMAIIAPKECEDNPQAYRMMENICHADDNPVVAVHYMDLRESMQNGGGPACLRLRVVTSKSKWDLIPNSVKYTPELHQKLENIIEKYYPDEIVLANLPDVEFANKCTKTYHILYELLGLEVNY